MKKTRILAIDDDADFLEAILRILRRAGYEAAAAEDAATGMRKAREERFDLLLLDVLMPDLDGFRFCERLRTDPATRDIPVLFLSARTDPTDVMKGFVSGGDDYLKKPIRAQELLTAVDRLLSGSGEASSPPGS